jgi:hypothetical protein
MPKDADPVVDEQQELLQAAIGTVLEAALAHREDAHVVALSVLTTSIADVIMAFDPEDRAEIAARAGDVIAQMIAASIEAGEEADGQTS